MSPEDAALEGYRAAPGRVCCGVCGTCRRDGVWVLDGICQDCWRKERREAGPLNPARGPAEDAR